MVTYMLFFLTVMLYMSMKKTDLSGHLHQELLRDLIIEEEFVYSDTHIRKNFHDIATVEEFWQFMQGPLANGLFPSEDIVPNGIGAVYSTSLLLGNVRLMQARMGQASMESCIYPPNMGSRMEKLGCYLDYTSSKRQGYQSMEAFGPKANSTAFADYNVSDCFTYTPASNYGMITNFLSTREGYTLGHSFDINGHSCDMNYANGTNFHGSLQVLRNMNWIDLETRFVAVIFTVLNPSKGIVTSVVLQIEIPITGGCIPRYTFSTHYLTSMMPLSFRLILYSLWTLCTLFLLGYIAGEIFDLYSFGIKAYFMDVWNAVDLSNYIIFEMTLLADITCWITMGSRLGDDFFNAHGVFYAADMANWGQSLNMLCLVIKMFKYLRASRQLNILVLIMKRAAKQLSYLAFISAVVLTGFVFAFYASFNTELSDYRTVGTTLTTLLRAFLGDPPDFNELMVANQFIGPLLWISYTTIFTIVLFSLILTIITDAHEVVMEEIRNDNSHDMILDRIFFKLKQIREKTKRAIPKSARRAARRFASRLSVVKSTTGGVIKRIESSVFPTSIRLSKEMAKRESALREQGSRSRSRRNSFKHYRQENYDPAPSTHHFGNLEKKFQDIQELSRRLHVQVEAIGDAMASMDYSAIGKSNDQDDGQVLYSTSRGPKPLSRRASAPVVENGSRNRYIVGAGTAEVGRELKLPDYLTRGDV
eukprot:g362.t1